MSIHHDDSPGRSSLIVRIARPLAVAFAALIAVIMLLIVVAFGFGMFQGMQGFRTVRIQAELHRIRNTSEAFLAKYGRWPTTPLELLAPPPLPDGTIPGPFLPTLPLDPFTNAPYLQGIDAQGAFFIETLGRDGLPGGSGADLDITVFSTLKPPVGGAAPPTPTGSDGEN